MTVKMSSEGDSSKNLPSEANERSEAENTDSSQDSGGDAKEAKAAENSTEKPQGEATGSGDAPKEAPAEPAKTNDDEKPTKTEKAEVSKNEVNATDKKEKEKPAKAAKKAEETEEEEADDSDKNDDGSDKGDSEEKDVPLLDQPLEKSGKRERKNVQRFNESEQKEANKIEIPSGSGTPLGDIPRIDACISRFKNDDMKLLHRILFKTPGKTTMIKKNIKKFYGFDFKKDSEEYNKKVASTQKFEVKQLKSVCEMLDLPKTGTKDDIVTRIIDLLLEPKDSGKGGGRPKRTAAVRANNRGYSSHDNYSSDEKLSGRTTRDKGKRPSLKEESSSNSEDDFEPSDDSDEKPKVTRRKRSERKKQQSDDEASAIDSASSEDSDFQDEPKNKRKKPAPKANNKAKGKTPGRRGRKPAAAKKTPKAGKKRSKDSSAEEDEESDHKEEAAAAAGSSSSEDEPLAKKAKSAQPPTDDEIKTYVKEILEGANLEQITMKTVCQQVYAHYPDFDLAHKKDFIKSTVKSLIST